MPLKPEDLIDHVQECMVSPPDDGRLFGRRLLRQRLKDEGVAAYNRQLPLRERNDRAHAVINNMYHQQLHDKEPVISNILRHGDAVEKPAPLPSETKKCAKGVQVVPASLEMNEVSDPPQRADPGNPHVGPKLTKGAFFDPNSGLEKRNAAIGTSTASADVRNAVTDTTTTGTSGRPLTAQKAAGLESRSVAVDAMPAAKPHAVVHPMDRESAKKTVPKPTWKSHRAREVNTDLKGFTWDANLLSQLPKVGSLHPSFHAHGNAPVSNTPRPVTARMASRPKDTLRFLF